MTIETLEASDKMSAQILVVLSILTFYTDM